MEKLPTRIAGACRLKPRIFADDRGFFLEAWSRRTFAGLGLDLDFFQDNHSHSRGGVLRGLHYQSGAAAQGKLVWVSSGRVFDVIVDLRRQSPTFGQWDGCILDTENHERLWVPAGCAHGFLVLSESADFHYKATAPYDPSAERTLVWNDPALAIAWPLEGGRVPVLSAKDAAGRLLADCETFG
jgi:dTDP-4-dehydrorhamnose 3,5-epimerase